MSDPTITLSPVDPKKPSFRGYRFLPNPGSVNQITSLSLRSAHLYEISCWFLEPGNPYIRFPSYFQQEIDDGKWDAEISELLQAGLIKEVLTQ